MNIKNIKIKIILSAVVLSVVGFIGAANAANSSLYISPSSLTKNVGDTFNVSVGVDAQGNKVCAAEGTLVFNNVTCQSITVASNGMAQSSPTCSNPYFLIGIPNCTTSNNVLLEVSIKAGNAGTASISLSGVDIIGEGASVGSSSIAGSYTINSIPVSTVVTPSSTPINNEPTQPVVQSGQEEIPQNTDNPAQETTAENDLATDMQASLESTSSKYINYFLMGFIIVIVLVIIYYFIKRKKK